MVLRGILDDKYGLDTEFSHFEDKHLKTIGERNASMLNKWKRFMNSKHGIYEENYKHRNDSGNSSNEDDMYPDDQLSMSDSQPKALSKTAKKDSKFLAPYAPGDKKKRYRRTADEIG